MPAYDGDLLSNDDLLSLAADPEQGIFDLVDLIEKRCQPTFGIYEYEIACVIIEYICSYLEAHPGTLEVYRPEEMGVNEAERLWKIVNAQLKSKIVRTQVVAASMRKAPEWRVPLNEGYRAQIRDMVNHIRGILDNADVPVSRKTEIISRLNSFSAEIEREETRLDQLGRVWLVVTRYVGEGAKNLDPVVRQLERVRKIIGNAQDEADEKARIEQEKRASLPRPDMG